MAKLKFPMSTEGTRERRMKSFSLFARTGIQSVIAVIMMYSGARRYGKKKVRRRRRGVL